MTGADGITIAEMLLPDDVSKMSPEEIGLVGEFKVMGRLRALGIELRAVRHRVDLWLDNGASVEVKAARLDKQNSYPFAARSTPADFVVVWAANADDFYVIPRQLIAAGVNRVYPSNKRWEWLRDNWQLILAHR